MKESSLDRILKYWPLIVAVGIGTTAIVQLKLAIQENTELAKATDQRVDYLTIQLTEQKAILNCVIHGCSIQK